MKAGRIGWKALETQNDVQVNVDAAGNITSYASNAYTFTQRGRMSEVQVGTNETDYIYNTLGQLIRKSGAGGTTLLMYDEAGHILGEYSASGAVIQETVWLGDTPVATLQPNGTSVSIYYVHTDHLSTPRKITRPSDNGLMWRWDPDTFGSVAPNNNPAGLGAFTYNLRFPGQYSLNESGLYYNYFRDYDPQVGRYIESDPIGLDGGSWSTYSYVNNSPISRIDPFGEAGAIPLPAPSPGLTLPEWLTIPATRALGIAGMVLSLSGDTPKQCPKECPPCKTVSGKIVPVGTIAYRPLDIPPAGKTEHGIQGPHHNLYNARQNPNNCQCFWQYLGAQCHRAIFPLVPSRLSLSQIERR